MKITFLGATKTVTGSKYLIDTGSKKLLVDCGLFQGHKELRAKNWQPLPIDPHELDGVILTHAHIDHTGYIPVIVKNGFSQNIFCSPGTRDLCNVLLMDSAYLQEEEAKYRNLHKISKHNPAKPLYTKEDAGNSLKQFHVVDFEREYEIPKTAKFTLYPAGHIVGASFVLLKSHGISILFSGDIGKMDDPVMYPPTPAESIEAPDYLVLESTYGDRLQGDTDPLEALSQEINATLKKHGSILIPSFAVGRAQNLLYMLYQLRQGNRIPHNVPIYVDSPMATAATKIFEKFANEHRLGKKLAHEVSNIATYIGSLEESLSMGAQKTPKIIISASGMAEGGRVLRHLMEMLPDPKNTILFVGFQVAGTRGDRLLKGEKEIRIYGQDIPVNARITFLENMSAHADYQGVLTWLKGFKKRPKAVFITHGEPDANINLKKEIEKELKWHCIIPEYLQTEALR